MKIKINDREYLIEWIHSNYEKGIIKKLFFGTTCRIYSVDTNKTTGILVGEGRAFLKSRKISLKRALESNVDNYEIKGSLTFFNKKQRKQIWEQYFKNIKNTSKLIKDFRTELRCKGWNIEDINSDLVKDVENIFKKGLSQLEK